MAKKAGTSSAKIKTFCRDLIAETKIASRELSDESLRNKTKITKITTLVSFIDTNSLCKARMIYL